MRTEEEVLEAIAAGMMRVVIKDDEDFGKIKKSLKDDSTVFEQLRGDIDYAIDFHHWEDFDTKISGDSIREIEYDEDGQITFSLTMKPSDYDRYLVRTKLVQDELEKLDRNKNV